MKDHGTETWVPNRPALVDAVLDADGHPPCDPADACPVCVLFTEQQTGETRADWLARLRDGAYGAVRS